MKRYNPIWLSSTQNFNSWQYRRYVAWKRQKGEPIDPVMNEPWSIYGYKAQNPNRQYGWGNMKIHELNNNGLRLTYYVLDEDYRVVNEDFNPIAVPDGLNVWPPTFIYHLNGNIDGAEYITVKDLNRDFLRKNANILPFVGVSAIACLSDYIPLNYDDFDFYRSFLRLENEVINAVSYCRIPNNIYRINTYEYKCHEGSFFNDIFEVPSSLVKGQLKYKGYDYRDEFFKIPELKDGVSSSEALRSSNLPNIFGTVNSSVGINQSSRILSMVVPTGGRAWSAEGSPDGKSFPTYFQYNYASGMVPTNTFYSINDIEKNPYLPLGGRDNPYEVQCLVFVRSSAGSSGRWWHIVNRYWWNPTEVEE